uniref:Nose resistant-to-fluoxetine protein N-terminal domain-containing protein n=1 Tax=Trichobilharzia regenti TaxID=157069 RepID=A0AA85K360_TRIRE|nr:unnamed protein product [Trichobilharzia regenti]
MLLFLLTFSHLVFLPPHIIAENAPIYSYENGLLLTLHSHDLKIQKPFIDIARSIQNTFVGIKPTLDPQQLEAHLVINNSACVRDIVSVIYGIFRLNEESIKWLDAAGKIVPGIEAGGINWIGSMELCQNITDFNYALSHHVKGKYCSAFVKLPTDELLPQKVTIELNYGMCIPTSCTKDDLVVLLDIVLSRVNLSLDNSTTFCHEEFGSVPKDGWFWISISILIIVIVLLLIGTTIDLIIWSMWKYQAHTILYNRLVDSVNSSESLASSNESVIVSGENIQEENTTGESDVVCPELNSLSYSKYRFKILSNMNYGIKFLALYSIPYNGWHLFQLKPSTIVNKSGQLCENPLLCLDGIRVLTMIWIIYGHCIVYSIVGSNNTLFYAQTHLRQWSFQAMVGAPLSVDAFFFMSGLLTTYLTLPKLRRICSWKNWFKFWCSFTFHRIVRLTPAYLLVLLLYTGLFIHGYSGPLYPQNPELTDVKFCRAHWWATYLNNFIYADEVCMGWSWYLSDELQFSLVLAPIFLSLLMCHEYIGISFAIALIISSIGSTYGISYANNYLPWFLAIQSFTTIYIKPYTRWSTYAIGLLCGWFLEKHPNILESVSRKYKVLLFTLGVCFSSIFCISTVYGLYGFLSGKLPSMTTSEAAAYTAFSRPVFILGVAIVVSMCALGCGGPIHWLLTSSVFRLPARITFTVYLVHPIVIQFIIFGRQSPAVLDNLYLKSMKAYYKLHKNEKKLLMKKQSRNKSKNLINS